MNGWTEERRRRQAELIHTWQPWKKAGVKTAAGKEISKMNALRHGMRSKIARQLEKALSRHGIMLRDMSQQLPDAGDS